MFEPQHVSDNQTHHELVFENLELGRSSEQRITITKINVGVHIDPIFVIGIILR